MVDEWRDVAVSYLAAESQNALATGPFGSSISSKYFQAHGVPVIRGSNLTTTIDRRLVEEGLAFLSPEKAAEFSRSVARYGDLVFTCWGTIGQVGLIDNRARYDEYVISNKQMKLTPDSRKADSLFLYYVFSSPPVSDDIKNQSIGSSVPGFNLGQLKSIRLRLPPLGMQRAIAAVLGALDDKIEQNRQTAQALERLARAIFRAWFVDFEPVKAKAAGATAFPSMPQPVFDALPTRFVDSDIGPVPEGWEVKGFGEVLVLAYGKALKADGRQPGSIPVYGSNGQVGWHNEAIAAGPGIVVGRKGNPGTVEWSHGPFFPIDTTFFVKLTDTRTSLPLLFYQLQAADLGRLATDSAVPGVNRNMIYAERCFVPRETVRAAFDSLALELWELQATLMRESAKLAEMRDFLLPKLLSGDVRVAATHGEGEEPA